MKRSAAIVLLLMGACDDDRQEQASRRAECTIEADSDVDCIQRGNSVGHTYFYNGHTYSCAWYNHQTVPASTYVPTRSGPSYAARSTLAAPARAAPTTSSRGGFGGTGSGGSS